MEPSGRARRGRPVYACPECGYEMETHEDGERAAAAVEEPEENDEDENDDETEDGEDEEDLD